GVQAGVGNWELGVGAGNGESSSSPTPNSQPPTPAFLTAARLFGAAAALREGDSPRWPADQADFERNLGALQKRLDPSALAAAWQEGAGFPLEESITLALAIP